MASEKGKITVSIHTCPITKRLTAVWVDSNGKVKQAPVKSNV